MVVSLQKQDQCSTFILKPSLIYGAGIGCFVENKIKRGEQLLPGYQELFRRLTGDDIPDPYLKYCMLGKDGLYLCPESFLKMGVFWYVNHSRIPNCRFDKGKLRAVVDLPSGTEVTLYYADLLSHPKNLLWCKAWDIDWSRHPVGRQAGLC